jgi:6-phosphogluconolactonase (cycloisomerase 2 family)
MRLAIPRPARGARLAALLALAVPSLALTAPQASAATGDLTQLGCVATKGEHGCVETPSTDTSFSPTNGAARVLDFGDTVYVASLVYGTVAWFDRGLDGSLAFEGCVDEDGQFGCDDAETDSLAGANGMAVSADGESFYLVSTGNGSFGAINWFERGPDGSLEFQGCLSNDGEYGCEDAANSTITGAWDIALLGDDVYVASTTDFVTRLSREADGSLAYGECFADGGAAGCADPGGEAQDPLDSPSGIAASPDGENLYVTAGNAHSVSVFARDPGSGDLTYMECHANIGKNGCEDPAKDSFGQPSGIAVSPDGESVYVTSIVSSSVSSFTRGAGGSLDYQGCVADGGAYGCVDPPIDALERTTSVDVDPAGGTVYVSTEPIVEPEDNGALLILDRGVAGALSFRGCIANDGFYGCADPPHDALAASHHLTVSEDGQNVYTTAYWGNAVTAFALEAPPLAPALTDTDPDSPADYNEPAVKGSAQAGSTVRLYTDAACAGTVAAEGTAAELEAPGLTPTVLDNTTTTFYASATDAEGSSPCSAGIVYEEVSKKAGKTPAPVLTGTDPSSPADDNSPRVLGEAEAGTTIHLYASATCEPPVLAEGTATELESPGIEVAVADDSTTTFHATATGVGGTSTCSAGVSYVEETPANEGGDDSSSADSSTASGPSAPSAAPAIVASPPVVASPAIALGRAAVLGRLAPVQGRKARVKLVCRGVAGAVCRGVLRLVRRVRGKRRGRVRRRAVVVGRARYALPAGARRVLATRLSRRGARLVRRRGRRGLRVRASGPQLVARSLKLKQRGSRR